MKDFLNLHWRTAAFVGLIIFVIGFAAGFGTSYVYTRSIELPVVSIERDTVVVRDTINGVVQPPKTERVIRVDTARINLKPVGDGNFKIDTTSPPKGKDSTSTPRITQDGQIAILISSKVYETEDYRAVVSGYKPSLDSIRLYPTRTTITNTVTKLKTKRPWLALTIGGGLSYAGSDAPIQAFNVGLRPTVGVGLGIVIKSW